MQKAKVWLYKFNEVNFLSVGSQKQHLRFFLGGPLHHIILHSVPQLFDMFCALVVPQDI